MSTNSETRKKKEPVFAEQGVNLFNAKGQPKVVQFKLTLNALHDVVPEGIEELRQEHRGADWEEDQKHADAAKEAGHENLAELGRIRENRVDTGNNAYQNIPFCGAPMLAVGLRNNGYALTDAHFYHRIPDPIFKRDPKTGEQVRVDLDPQNVVVLTFEHGGAKASLSEKLRKALVELSRISWKYCHVWDNPGAAENPEGTITVNMVFPQKESKAEYEMIVRRKGLWIASEDQVMPAERPSFDEAVALGLIPPPPPPAPHPAE